MMETPLWIVGIVFGIGVLLFVGHHVKETYRRRHSPLTGGGPPAPGTTPPATPAEDAWWKKSIKYGKDHWLELFLPPVVTAGVIFAAWSAFPVMYPRYVAHGGLTLSLILVALLLGLALLIPQRLLRVLAVATIALVFGGAVLYALVPAVFGATPPCAVGDTKCLKERAEEAAAREAARRQQEQAARVAAQPSAPQCNVHRVPYRYEKERPAKAFNPGGVCAPALFVDGRWVYVTQNLNDKQLGPYFITADGVVRNKDNQVVELPVDIDRVWSAEDAAFEGSVGLWQPRYTKFLSIR